LPGFVLGAFSAPRLAFFLPPSFYPHQPAIQVMYSLYSPVSAHPLTLNKAARASSQLYATLPQASVATHLAELSPYQREACSQGFNELYLEAQFFF